MSSFVLKWIAIVTMLIDHIAFAMLPVGSIPYYIMRAIGRISFPLFAFMIAEGYFHTKNYKKYLLRMAFFILISEVPFDLFCFGRFPDWRGQSIFLTLTIALAALYFFDRLAAADMRIPALAVLLAAALIAQITRADYSSYGILIVFIFYFHRGNPRALISWFSATALIYSCLKAVGEMPYVHSAIFYLLNGFSILALVPILLYNKKKGCNSAVWKYFFYIFYPLHILIIYLIKLQLNI